MILATITSPKRQCADEKYHLFIIFAVFNVSVNIIYVAVNAWLNCGFFCTFLLVYIVVLIERRRMKLVEKLFGGQEQSPLKLQVSAGLSLTLCALQIYLLTFYYYESMGRNIQGGGGGETSKGRTDEGGETSMTWGRNVPSAKRPEGETSREGRNVQLAN